MSTSDAAELELRVVGGETATRRCRTATRTAAVREPQDEKFKQESRRGDETAAGQQRRPSAVIQEETHRALSADRLRQEEAAHCGDSEVQTQKPAGPRFTSCLFFRLSHSLSCENPEQRLKTTLDRSLLSLTEKQTTETENSSYQVNGQTSPPNTSAKVASDSSLSESITAKKNQEVITSVCNELEITRDLSITQTSSDGESGPRERNGLFILPCGLQPRTGTRSAQLEEDIKDNTKLEKQADLVELSKPVETMLSSTVATVLAPHWSNRLRRSKRFDGPSSSEDQGNFEAVKNITESRTREQFQQTMDRSLTEGLQAQLRVPSLGTRSYTVGCSPKTSAASLDSESKRKMLQTVSLDVNSGTVNNRKSDAGALSLGPNEQRRNPQTGHQEGLSSKPTTSSLLLSLRRLNTSGRSTNAASTFSEINPSPLSISPRDQDGKLFTAHLSQTFHNNNVQERPKPLLSPLSVSYRTTETGPIFSTSSPSSSNHRETTKFETQLFSASPTNKDAEATRFTQQPQTTNTTESSLSCSKQVFLSRGPPERQPSCRGSDKRTNLFSESSVPSPRHSPYNRPPLQKTHSVPRRTTLTSTSWWKQVTQEGSSPLTLNDDKTQIKDEPNTLRVSPCIDKSDLVSSPRLVDNKRCSSQIANNRDNNNTTESVLKGNMNFFKNTLGGSHNLKQRNTEDSPDHESDRIVKQQYDSDLKIREPQKPHGRADVMSCSKISRATVQTILSHPKDLTKHNVSNSSFTANATEISPILPNPKSPNTPTESVSKSSSNNYPSKTNNSSTSPQNINSQSFTKPYLSLATANTLNSQALTSKTASGLPLTPKTKTSCSFYPLPVASQATIHASSYSCSSSQAPKFTTNITPLGFERSFASAPKPFHPKTGSSLIPTVSGLSKTNYGLVSTASTSSSIGSCPAATTVPSPALLTPPVTPVLVSSPTAVTNSSLLTPPATPINASPNYSDTSSPKEGGTLLSSKESEPKKLRPPVEGKKVRRVTWEDSVALQSSESITVEKPESSHVPASSPSPSRSPQNIKAPSIFSFLRSSAPATNPSPLCSPTPKTSSIQVVKGEKYRSLSSDSADLRTRERGRSQQRPNNTMISDQGRRHLTTPRQERTLSVESGTVHCHTAAPDSLPPDFSSGYKHRYSSPPYSTLMSTRSTQGDTQTVTPRSPHFQQRSQSDHTPHLSKHTDAVKVVTLSTSRPPLSPVSLPQPLSLPFQNKTAARGSSKYEVSEGDRHSNDHSKKTTQDRQNGQILLVNNRVHISSQSLQGDKAHSSSSTFVTETLVYSIKSRVDAAPATPKITIPKTLKYTANTPVSVQTKLSKQSQAVQSKEATGEPRSHLDQGSSSSSSSDSHLPDDENSNRRVKESLLGKSRFFSVESNNEQSPKRSRFALKKSVSTPNTSLSRSDSDRANKSNNKMDQVLNRLRQTFSTVRRSDDDILFPWKWKRASQTPSVSGSSDVSNVSDVNVESTKTLDKQQQVLKGNEKGTELMNRWTQNRYTLTIPSASGSAVVGDNSFIWSDKSSPETDQDEQNACAERASETKNQPRLTIHAPTTHHFDFYKDSGTDYESPNQFLPYRDPSPGLSPNPSTAYPAQIGRTTSSPRSPFSPFSSLSPVSSFPSPDVTDDSVFYSPKLQRRRESSSPCEPGEGISLGGSRRSRASTGPPSASPGRDEEWLASSYADLKYGIEPGRSFSVRSVLSSRPSGPGRISTGSRFLSVGNLSESSLTYGSTGRDLDHCSFTPDWSSEYECRHSKDCQMSYFLGDPGKMRSRSLPRSLTRRLANWSSAVSTSPPVNATAPKPARLWCPNMNTCHFAWDIEGPPTPPPTPPLSPVSRRMSKSPCLSSPTGPSSPGAPQQMDSQSSRGHLPSRGYISSLGTFEESSDCSSDTTTDDEYYLGTGEDEEKETEL